MKEKPNFDEAATKLKYEKLGDMIELALKTKDLEKVKRVLSLIRRYRKSGLDKTGEFGPENLAFKAVRKQGLVQRLYDLRNKLEGESLSIAESTKSFPNIVNDIITAVPSTEEIWFHGSRATKKHRRNSDWDILVVVDSEVVGSSYIDIVFVLHDIAKKYKNFDIQPSHPHNHITLIAREEGKLLWKKGDNSPITEDTGFRYYKNPTPKQLYRLTEKSKHKHMRGIYHNGKTYWWDANDAIHKIGAEELGLPYSYLNRMESAIDSISKKYYVGGDENVPDEIIQKYNIEDELVLETPNKNILDKNTLTVDELAKKHRVSRIEISKQLNKGIKVELEHTSSKKVAREIALDHLSEDPAYYDKLVKAQLEEASGYIPSEKEKNDPRFKTALTVDVKPDAIRKNTKAFNWKTSRAGIPPELKTNGLIEHYTNKSFSKLLNYSLFCGLFHINRFR